MIDIDPASAHIGGSASGSGWPGCDRL